MAARSYGQYCGVTTAVELLGERWALLIVRDLLVGPRRYTDLKQGLPRIPTNILSTRLKELQEGGVVRRVPLRNCGLVYELTDYGRALEPVILALGRWGFQTMGDPGEGDIVTPDSLTMALRASVRDGTLSVARVRGAQRRDEGSEAEADAVIVAGPGIRRLISGELTPAEALEQDVLAVVRGDVSLLDDFARTFHIAPLAVQGVSS